VARKDPERVKPKPVFPSEAEEAPKRGNTGTPVN